MILSNGGMKPEVEVSAITILGDTLGKNSPKTKVQIRRVFKYVFILSANHNKPYAAQFCYLMANIPVSSDSKLGNLLGFIPSKNNVLEATQMTEIYEFAVSLSTPDYSLGTSFIESKLNYTRTVLSCGFVPQAYQYLELMSKSLSRGSIHEEERRLAINILYLAERLVKTENPEKSEEPGWIEDLKRLSDPTQGSESTYSRKPSFATSTSDKGNELPSAMEQLSLNNYGNQYDQSAISNIGLSQDIPSTGLKSEITQPVPPSYQDQIAQNSNQWTQQNQVDASYDPNSYQAPATATTIMSNQSNQNQQSSAPSYDPPANNFQSNGSINPSYGNKDTT
jgi:hypothetical protein